MAKKKDVDERLPEPPTAEVFDPFVGGEDDDLMDMEYVQDETTETVDTHPPETKEEAEALEEAATKQEPEDDVQPDEGEETAESPETGEEEVAEAEDTEEEEESAVLEEPKIPKDRFDEVNERMKKAEDKVKQLETQLENVVEDKTPEPEPEPYDYAAKEKEAIDAVLEGDTDKYATIQAEIRQATRDETLREAKKLASQGDEQLAENISFEEAGARIESQYPEFVEGDENYNSAAREEMIDLYVGYSQSGRYTRVEALQRAAEKAATLYSLGKTEPEPEPGKVVDIKKGDPKKKAKAANAQPPLTETSSKDTSEPKRDINSMSDEEYESIPESTKRRMRGDIL